MSSTAEAARRLNLIRRVQGVAVLPLSKATGIPRVTLSRFLNGQGDMAFSRVLVLANELQAPASWLDDLPIDPPTHAPSILTWYTEDENGCWLWTGRVNKSTGYGEQANDLAHRLFYESLVGEIPAGLELDHLCRVHRCVNPSHLEAVTHRVNVLRGVAARRVAA